ncbi:hypothetical protein BGZ95_008438 [Linnemannia exigua]|uniref:HCP-like protein n=1 Tax=Linnemannia exigua TaxID=604196 RepID=A0AAD4DE27_9FUNG|nr:hypothetical protein BGZ95_008438 [Linnemannia exigua]
MLHAGNPTDNDRDAGLVREGEQVVRLASRNKIVHVATHFDESVGVSGKEIVFLDPWRIAAIPGAVLDVIVAQEEQPEATGTAGIRGVSPVPPPSSSSSSSPSSIHGRTPSTQPMAPEQRDTNSPPTRIVPPLIPKRPVQTASVTLTPPTSSSSSSGVIGEARGTMAGGQANTGRSPEYGLPEAAMANFGHFDLPPEFLATLQRKAGGGGGGLTAATAESGGRAPQVGDFGADEGATSSPSAAGPEGGTGVGTEKPLPREPQQQYGQTQAQVLTQPRGAPQIQIPSSSSSSGTTAAPSSSSDAAGSNGHTNKIGNNNNKPAVVVDAAVLETMISQASAGDTAQQVALGDMYREWKDYKKAMEWYLKAATLRTTPTTTTTTTSATGESGKEARGSKEGDLRAQYNIGFMYQYGEGVGRNFRTAVEWYDRAAKQGDGLAGYKAGKLRRDGLLYHSIGTMHTLGKGVIQDSALVIGWFLKAAREGHLNTQNQLGRQQSSDRALNWYRQAAADGPPSGKGRLDSKRIWALFKREYSGGDSTRSS